MTDEKKSLYPKTNFERGAGSGVLYCDRMHDRVVGQKGNLPGNIIVIHGVNDVGVGYDQVEQGLCAGLNQRLSIDLRAATYKMPTTADKDVLYDDPDDLFFKRTINKNTYSPVIPFYWGYADGFRTAETCNGQQVDRYGNRLDKDRTKGGGPFVNATSTIPDMWNRGSGAPLDPVGDPIRPIFNAPGRMYMVLAAKRLMALISMIRDYDKNEVVTLVAHSQGTMISLLAQAFLVDQRMRPADTLILMNSPYSLEQETTFKMGLAEAFSGGTDRAMTEGKLGNQYRNIAGRQTFEARLDTLVNIVHSVAKNKNTAPAFAKLDDHGEHRGMVGGCWVADKDRDNRGKVYLYFSPEDMTVALDNVQGIGWQGVPDSLGDGKTVGEKRHPMAELCKPLGAPPACGFYQRVFTNKLRLDPKMGKAVPVKVGQAPHDFALRIKGEDDHGHVAESGRGTRGRAPAIAWPIRDEGPHWYESKAWHDNALREGIRTINGEALPTPFAAELRGSQIDPKDIPKTSDQAKVPAKDQGPCEEIYPDDAATALTSPMALRQRPQERIVDPRPVTGRIPGYPHSQMGSGEIEQLQTALNYGKDVGDRCKVVRAFHEEGGMILLTRNETPNEARLRWQHELSPKSFHSAVFGNKANHEHVTAYDVAIGGGLASTHPDFYRYLCAVADWRLKKPSDGAKKRPNTLTWEQFQSRFAIYWAAEASWRRGLIEGNADYYSKGDLPGSILGLRESLPTSVVCQKIGETTMRHAKPVDVNNAGIGTGIAIGNAGTRS